MQSHRLLRSRRREPVRNAPPARHHAVSDRTGMLPPHSVRPLAEHAPRSGTRRCGPSHACRAVASAAPRRSPPHPHYCSRSSPGRPGTPAHPAASDGIDVSPLDGRLDNTKAGHRPGRGSACGRQPRPAHTSRESDQTPYQVTRDDTLPLNSNAVIPAGPFSSSTERRAAVLDRRQGPAVFAGGMVCADAGCRCGRGSGRPMPDEWSRAARVGTGGPGRRGACWWMWRWTMSSWRGGW
jgi:hypothetical protein